MLDHVPLRKLFPFLFTVNTDTYVKRPDHNLSATTVFLVVSRSSVYHSRRITASRKGQLRRSTHHTLAHPCNPPPADPLQNKRSKPTRWCLAGVNIVKLLSCHGGGCGRSRCFAPLPCARTDSTKHP